MTLVNVVVSGGAGTSNNGILNNSYSSPVMTLVNAVVTGGTETFGVSNIFYSSPVMTDIHIIASGGTSNYGVYNQSSSPIMTNVHTVAFGGTKSYGVWNSVSSSPMIRRCTMNGGTDGLFTDTDSTATVSQSTILNGVSGSGTKSCVACDNGSGGALNQFTCN